MAQVASASFRLLYTSSESTKKELTAQRKSLCRLTRALGLSRTAWSTCLVAATLELARPHFGAFGGDMCACEDILLRLPAIAWYWVDSTINFQSFCQMVYSCFGCPTTATANGSYSSPAAFPTLLRIFAGCWAHSVRPRRAHPLGSRLERI